jgi:hypothetical protein
LKDKNNINKQLELEPFEEWSQDSIKALKKLRNEKQHLKTKIKL